MVSLLFTWLACLAALALVVWIAGAIYFDVGRASPAGAMLAIAWVALAVALMVFWRPAWQPVLAIALVSGLFLRWWFSQQPSHYREWNANFAQLPRVSLEGDVITIDNVRNAEYRSIQDSTTHYETRTYRLSELRGVDALVLYWGSGWISHPMFVFDFGPDGRVCISIEVRYRVGQAYSLLRSLYRQQELIYVVSDERDAILRRTKYLPGHDLYLYRLHAGAVAIRQFFFEYATSINSLAERPRWYHGLTTNCTTSIYLQGRGRMQWDWRMLLNGSLDRLLYDRQLLDQHLPFEELKRQSWVNEIANSAPVDGFGEYIRRELPGYRKQPARDSREPIAVGDGPT
jgi:hypothetical protein